METDKNFRDIFKSLPDAVFLVNKDSGLILDANQSASDLLKRSIEEIVGLNQSEILAAGDDKTSREILSAQVQRSYSSEKSLTMESDIIRSDGKKVPVEIKAQLFAMEKDTLIIQVFRDITERKQMEEEMFRKSLQFKTILDKAPIGLSYMDRDMRTIWINAFIEKKFGYRSEDVKGWHCYENFGKYARDDSRKGKEKICDECQVVKTLTDGNMHVHERQINENYVIMNTSVPIKDSQGEIIGVLEMIQDITERKKAEKKLMESYKNHETYVLSVADGLRNPLQVSLLNLEIMDTQNFSQAQKEIFESLKNSNQKLKENINFLTGQIGIKDLFNKIT